MNMISKKRKNTLKSTFIKALKQTLQVAFIKLPAIVENVALFIINSIAIFKSLSKKKRFELVGFIICITIAIPLTLKGLLAIIKILGLFIWACFYGVYCINPDFFDIFIEFAKNISEAVSTLDNPLF